MISRGLQEGVFNDDYAYFFIFFMKAYGVGTHLNGLNFISASNLNREVVRHTDALQ